MALEWRIGKMAMNRRHSKTIPDLTNKRLIALCKRLDACAAAGDWLRETGFGSHEAFAKCQHADWILWLAGTMCQRRGWPTHKTVVLAACAVAATALKFVPKSEKRPAHAIRVARLWVRGKATIEEVRAAADAAYAAYAAAYAAGAAGAGGAAYAAYAAAGAAAYANIVRRVFAREAAKVARTLTGL